MSSVNNLTLNTLIIHVVAIGARVRVFCLLFDCSLAASHLVGLLPEDLIPFPVASVLIFLGSNLIFYETSSLVKVASKTDSYED